MIRILKIPLKEYKSTLSIKTAIKQVNNNHQYDEINRLFNVYFSSKNSLKILYKYCQKITVSVNWFFGRQYSNCLQQNNQTQSIELTLFTLGPICEVVCLYIEWPEVGRNVATPGFVLRPHDLESCRALWLESGPRWLKKEEKNIEKPSHKMWRNCFQEYATKKSYPISLIIQGCPDRFMPLITTKPWILQTALFHRFSPKFIKV